MRGLGERNQPGEGGPRRGTKDRQKTAIWKENERGQRVAYNSKKGHSTRQPIPPAGERSWAMTGGESKDYLRKLEGGGIRRRPGKKT